MGVTVRNLVCNLDEEMTLKYDIPLCEGVGKTAVENKGRL